MDTDLEAMTREQLIAEVRKLRDGIRTHRDSSGHDLCWHQPALWSLLPEKSNPIPVVPEWPEFMAGCVKYRGSLDRQAPKAPRTTEPYHMQNDEQEIRQLVSTWMAATKAGDVDKVLSLMADDSVFLVTGQPPMRKADFAVAARAQSGVGAPTFDGSSEVREIKVLGDWAFMWQKLTVEVAPPNGAPSIKRAGHTLTIFAKQNGRWVLARDANMLAPASQ